MLGLAATFLTMAACSGPPVPSGAPTVAPPGASAATTTPIVSVAPSPSPDATLAGPSATTGAVGSSVFSPGSAVKVSVAELNVREAPTTSAKRVITLKKGNVLIVGPTELFSGWGPIEADGYTWYPILQPGIGSTAWTLPALPTAPVTGDESAVTGWVATRSAASTFVTAVEPRCPSTVDLLNVSGMLPAERISCFTAPIVLQGTYGCGGCGGERPGSFAPSWLATPMEFGFLSVKPASQIGPLAIRIPPGGPTEIADGTIIKATLHVNDPLSGTCAMSELGDGGALVPINHDTAVLYCRERFVLDSYEILGTDPTFPFN
jgi:hypothetical protein